MQLFIIIVLYIQCDNFVFFTSVNFSSVRASSVFAGFLFCLQLTADGS